MNKLALFVFVKDEIDFIEHFIEYHKNIFDEITVIDNGSTDGTLEVLDRYSKYKVINLIRDSSPFSMKGEICSKIMSESTCDLLVGLDADEIMVFDDNETQTKDTAQIKAYLKNLPITGAKFKINKIYEYHPDNDGWYGLTKHAKIIFPKKTFMYTDGGFHRGRTLEDDISNFNTHPFYWRPFNKGIITTDKVIDINISYVHYHFKNKEIWLKNTVKKLKARIGDKYQDIEYLKTYFGPSIHCKTQYLYYLETGNWIKVNKQIFLGYDL